MSDERLRHIVRRALNPVVGKVGDGPEWAEVSQPMPAPGRNSGWRVALTAATVVAVVIGIVGLVADDTAVTDAVDDETTLSTPSTEVGPTGSGIVVSANGEIVFPDGVHPVDALGTGAGPLIVITTTDPPGDGEPPADQALVSAIDPDTGETVWSQPLGDGPSRLAVSDDAVWVAHFWTGALTKLSLTTGEVLATATPQLPFDVGSGPDRNEFIPNDLEVAFGSVWMSTARGAVARFDLDDGTVQSVIPILVEGTPGYIAGFAADDTWLWIAGDGGGLDRLDPADDTRRRLTAEELGQRAGSVIALNEGVVIGGSDDSEGRTGRIALVDPTTLTVIDSSPANAWVEVVEIAEKPIARTEAELRPITFTPLSLGDPLLVPSMPNGELADSGALRLAPSDHQWRILPSTRSIIRIGAETRRTVILPECTPGVPKQGIDLRFEDLIRYYNVGAADQMISVIGDGPVSDPSLEPERDVVYPSVAAWLDAAQGVGDRITTNGYGMGEPFELFVDRSNPDLETDGIERLSLTFRIWANQNCQLRVETTDEASYPDVCLYSRLHEPDAIPVGCTGPYEPRAGHAAVWTGTELLIVGGTTGTAEPLPIALRLDGSTRSLAPPPRPLGWHEGMDTFWTGDRLIVVVGGSQDLPGMIVLTYTPETDSWTESEPLPSGLYLGGVTWTGSELLFVGGVHNGPNDQAWRYTLATGEWARLPDPGIEPVEGMEGVWTGTEAVFYGGYAGAGESPGVAWNPAAGTWRALPATGRGNHIQGHRMVWTGDRVIVHSGHAGPGHPDRLLIYDPNSDTWSESAPIPITPAERLGADWTGNELIIWGGYATYGDGHVSDRGALYDPATDTWTVMADSPLGARCDHSLSWTGEVAVAFGGVETCGHPNFIPSGDGAAYDVASAEWQILGRG
ncbi:MAG: hypothetical protein WD156_08815 [Acidimicrobiia bacterium]